MRKRYSVLVINRAGMRKRISVIATSVNNVYRRLEKQYKIVSVCFVSIVIRKKKAMKC